MNRLLTQFIWLFISLTLAQGAVSQNSTCGFQFKKTITIQGSRVAGGAHTNFPVLISHTDNDLRTTGNGGDVTNANGYDIIFADNNGDPLAFQLEHYVATSGRYVAWVRIPSLTNGTDVTIHMLYGKSSITTDQSSTSVWSSGYHGVWHLNNGVFTDATGNGYNGTNNGSTNQTGAQIAGGRTFTDPNHWIELSSFPNMSSSFTISGWVRTVDNTEQGQRVFCDDAGNNNGGYALSIGDGGTGNVRFYVRGLSNVILDSPTSTINNNTWYHVAAVLDRTTNNKYLYVNGAQVATQTATGTLSAENGNASIGGEVASGESGNRFDGDLDEIRSYNGILSANWLLTEYRSQSLPTSYPGANANDFYTVGAEEDLFHTSTGAGDWDQTGIWDSGEVPNGMFENVVISHDVDIDAGSANYTVCNCAIVSTGAQNAFLDINSTRTLGVFGDMTATLSGTGTSSARFQFFENAVITVDGDITVTRSNSDAAADFTFQVMDNVVLSVAGNVSLSQSAGDDFTVTVEDNADFIITGDLNFSLSGGDIMQLNLEDNADFTVGDDVVITHSGGNDMNFYLNNTSGTAAEWLVAGDMTITHTAGDDVNFLVDDAGSLLDVDGTFTATCTGSAESQVLFIDLDNGNFNTGNAVISRGTDFGSVNFDMDGGNFTCTGFDLTSSGTFGGAKFVRFDVDQSSDFTVNGNFTHTMSSGDDFTIYVNVGGGTTATFVVTGNFTVTRSGGDDINIQVDDDNSLFSVGGNFTITTSAGEQITIDLDEDATMEVGGNFTITHTGGLDGLMTMEHNANASNPTFNVDGTFTLTLNSDGDNYNFNLDGGTFTVGTNMILNNISAGTNGYIAILPENDLDMNIGGNLTMTLSGGDDLLLRTGVATASTATIDIGGNWTMDHNGATGGDDMTNIINDNCTLSVGGNLVIDSDFNTIDLLQLTLNNSSQLTVLGNIQFAAAVQGKSELELNNTSRLRIGGNFVRAAAPNDFGILDCNNTSTLEFIGTAAQTFPQDDGGGTDDFDFQNVIINNTFGTAPQLTMQGLATIHTGITFTDGIISSTSSNILVIDNNASTAGASDASHVDGFVRKVGNTPAGDFAGNGYAFPVGDLGVYRPIYISAPGNTTDQFNAQYIGQNPDASYDTESLDNALFLVSTEEYWILDRTGTSSVNVRLSWNANSLVGNLPTLRVTRWNGTLWADHGNGGTTGNTTAGTVISSAAVGSFSPFTLGSTGNANPLPIELISFTGTKNEEGHLLEWTTATEKQNDYFTLERANQVEDFAPIAQIPGARNSYAPLSYSHLDRQPAPGINYYRLSQTDIDGTTEYFSTISLYHDEGASHGVIVAPNPADQGFSIHSSEHLHGRVQLLDALGRIAYEADLVGTAEFEIPTFSIPEGIYVLRYSDKYEEWNVRVVVQH